MDAKGEIKVKLSTTHTTAVSCAVYLNGKQLVGEGAVNTSVSPEFAFDASLLNLAENALNVLYVPVYKANGSLRGITSVFIRVSSVNAAEDEVAINCGGELYVTKKDSSFTLPEITAKREGFVACGWTTGTDTVYLQGEEIKAENDEFFFVRWKRTDIFSAMKME